MVWRHASCLWSCHVYHADLQSILDFLWICRLRSIGSWSCRSAITQTCLRGGPLSHPLRAVKLSCKCRVWLWKLRCQTCGLPPANATLFSTSAAPVMCPNMQQNVCRQISLSKVYPSHASFYSMLINELCCHWWPNAQSNVPRIPTCLLQCWDRLKRACLLTGSFGLHG